MERTRWIDQLKCFAIFTVVAGHMMSCDAYVTEYGLRTYSWILSFHMPLFIMLSGWFFSVKDDWRTFLRKRSIGIALPYFVWGIVWYFALPLIQLLLSGQQLHLSSVIWQLKFLLDDGLLHYGWWFLRGLFFCYLLAYSVVRFAQWCGSRHPYLAGGLCSCILLYILLWCGIIPNMPSKDDILKGACYLYPFFWTGVALRKSEDWIDRSRRWLSPLSGVLFVSMLFIWFEQDYTFYLMNTSAIAPVDVCGWQGLSVVYATVFRYLIGVVAAVFWIVLFKSFSQRDTSFSLRLFDLTSRIGQETLGIYILQSLVYWSLPHYKLLPDVPEYWILVGTMLLSVVIILIAYWIISFTKRNQILALLLWGKALRESTSRTKC